MKIYDNKGNELWDVLITKDAVHEEELMKSDFVRLSWNDVDNTRIPADAYIIPFDDVLDYDGQPIRYSLLEPYMPEQKSEAEYKYEPVFHHPKMYLSKVPFTHTSRIIEADTNVQTTVIDSADWSYAGSLSTLLEYFCECINKAIGIDGKIGFEIVGDVPTSVFASFQSQDILSALSNIANVQECEWHIDWQTATLYFGHIIIDHNEPFLKPVLSVNENIGVSSKRDSKEGFWNAYLPKGSSRNVTKKAVSGESVQSLVRVSLQPGKDYLFTSPDGTERTIQIPDGIVYTDEDGNILTKGEFDSAGHRKHVKSVIFEDVYPRQDLYLYDIRYREKYVMQEVDGKEEKVVEEELPDGTKIYKKFAIWYAKLARPIIENSHVTRWEQYMLKKYYTSMKFEAKNPDFYTNEDEGQEAMYMLVLNDYTKQSWERLREWYFSQDGNVTSRVNPYLSISSQDIREGDTYNFFVTAYQNLSHSDADKECTISIPTERYYITDGSGRMIGIRNQRAIFRIYQSGNLIASSGVMTLEDMPSFTFTTQEKGNIQVIIEFWGMSEEDIPLSSHPYVDFSFDYSHPSISEKGLPFKVTARQTTIDGFLWYNAYQEYVLLRIGAVYDNLVEAQNDPTGIAFLAEAQQEGSITLLPSSEIPPEVYDYMPKELERSPIISGKEPIIAFQPNTYMRQTGTSPEGLPIYRTAESTPLAGRGEGDGEGHYGFSIFVYQTKKDVDDEMKIYSDDVATDVSELPQVEIGDIEIIHQDQNDYTIPTREAQGIIPKGALKDNDEKVTTIEELNAIAVKDDGKIGNKVNIYNIIVDSSYEDNAERELATEISKYIKNQFIDNNSYTFKSNPIAFKESNPNLYIGQEVTYKDLSGYTIKTRVMKLVTHIDFPFEQEITVGNEQIKGTQQQLKEQVSTILSGGVGGDGSGGMNRTQVLSLISSWVTPRFLQKTIADTADGVITFVRGIVAKAKSIFVEGFTLGNEGRYGFDGEGNGIVQTLQAASGTEKLQILKSLGIERDATVDGILTALSKIISNNIQTDNYTGDGAFDTGFNLNKTGDGITHMVVDNLFVRMKAIFTELEIRKISYAGGNIIFSHAGSKVVGVKKVGNAYRCYLLSDDGSTATENWWRIDDQARWQTFNIKEGVYENVQNTFGWRKVVGIGSEVYEYPNPWKNDSVWDYERFWNDVVTRLWYSNEEWSDEDEWKYVSSQPEDAKVYDYIDLSKDDCIANSDIPKAGDQLVQMGNRTDASRQGFITIEVMGEDAPAFKVYKNVNSYSLDGNRKKICLSPKNSELKVQKLTIETEYDTMRVPNQRTDDWYEGMQCYYYDIVQHNGASWLCTYPESGIGDVMYTTEEPSETATYWKLYAQKGQKGDKGDSVSYDEEHSYMQYAYSSHGSAESGREYPSDITSWSNSVPPIEKGKYLWTKDVTAYDNAGTIVYTTTYGVQYQPEDGDSGRSLKSQTEYYMADSSNAEKQVPTSTTGWSDNPNINNWNETNKYLWNMEQVVYTESNGTETTTYTKPHILAIWTKNGKGIDSIQNYYKISASNTDVVVDDFNTEGSNASIDYTTRYDKNTTQCKTITFTGNAITDNAFSGVLKIGGVFHAGDVISIRPFTQMSASQISSGRYANVGLYNSNKNRVAFLTSNDGGATASDSSSSRSVTDGHEESGTPALFTYTLSQDITDLYIGRASGSVRINLLLIEITRNGHTIVKWENGVLTMTGDDGTWTTTTQVPTDEKPYLWNYEQITWLNSDGTTSITKTDPSVIGSRGAKGTSGYNTATVPLYQRYTPTQQNPTPAKPNGTLTYTFSTGLLSGTGFNGWSQTIPAATANSKLFITQAVARSIEGTDTIDANEWATPIEYVKDGENGEPGISSAPIVIYKRSSSIPDDKPSNNTRYYFKTVGNIEAGSLVPPSDGSLNDWSTNIPSGTNPVYTRQATALAIATADYDEIEDSEWSDVVKYVENGSKGDDAVSVIISPSSMIVNQDINDVDNLDNLTETFVVKVMKGTVSQIVNAITFTAEKDGEYYKASFLKSGGSKAGTGTIGGNTLTLKQINKYEQNDKWYYYDNVYVDMTINYGNNKTVSGIRANIYVNLIGTWKETIEGDTRRAIAESTTYEVNGETCTVKNNLGTFVESSTERTSRLEREVTVMREVDVNEPFDRQVHFAKGNYILYVNGAYGSPNAEYTACVGNHTYSWEEGENLEREFTISQDGNYSVYFNDSQESGVAKCKEFYIKEAAVTSSELKQTADSISTEVKGIKNGKNLLSGVLTGSGWKSCASLPTSSSTPTYHDITVGANGNLIRATNDTYLVSPTFQLIQGKEYTLSFTGGGNFMVYVKNVSSGNVTDIYSTHMQGGGRLSTNFTSSANYNVARAFFGINLSKPQIETGSEATAFEAGDTEVSSQIKQTADQITAKVNATGVDITNGLIQLIANKTLFLTEGNVPMIAVQMCNANGEVGTGSGYTIPSIVFYNGQIGQTGVSVQWVLNYLGFIRATNAGEQYSFSSVPRVICFEAPTGDKVNHIGVDSQYELDSESMALTWFNGREKYEQMYLFNSGYYINDSGVKIYQPANGKNYEMYNDMPDLRRYWLTRNVNNIFVPDLTTNATAKGYYCIVAEGNYEGNWPIGDQWHTVSSNRNRAGANDPAPVDPTQEVIKAIKFHLVYFDETSFSESGPAGVMERYENAFVLFYHGWIRGALSGIWKTCIAAIGGNDNLENNPTFYNDTFPDGICTIQSIIDKYNE